MVDIEKVRFGIFIFGLVGAACYLLASLPIWWNIPILVAIEVDAEIVNGILTVSGIIFGFEFAFFKAPNKIARILWLFSLISQMFLIGWVGFKYLSDTMSYGYLTTNTLLSAYLSFSFVLFFTIVLGLFEWVFSSKP